ncbi:MAG: DNA recombination protein RmuC [Candidatus Poseidoniales archaeon]|jgi:DNA recombination protein RmuC
MDPITVGLLSFILIIVIGNSILQQKRFREIQAMAPEKTEEPDYIERFKEIGAGALLEVIEQRKATVEDAVLENLPLDDIKQQNLEIMAKFEELDELTVQMKTDNEATRATTKGLSMALSVGIGERGNWGESSFESILNMSGLVENITYHPELVLIKSSRPLSRPDFTVMLSDGSAIAIDSKALLGPLIGLYDQAMEIPKESERNAAFTAIADNIWNAIMSKDGIKLRNYPLMLEEHFGIQGPSFTLVFIPGDHILSMAYKNDKGRSTHGRKNVPLQEAAYLNGVLLATPTMVMALLTMIRDEWAAYKIDEDTQKIQNLAVELYERHVSFGTRLGDIGKGLKNAIKSYDDAIKSYQGAQSIRNTGEKMVKAGIKEKAANKELPNPMDSTDWANPPEIDQSKFIGIPGDDEE